MTNLPIDVLDESWVQAAADAVRTQWGQVAPAILTRPPVRDSRTLDTRRI
ncbi:hypothetical protein ACWCOV_00490 [Kribbella sp. NPDC002412]